MMSRVARVILLTASAFGLGACVTGGGSTTALAPEPANVTALDGGLVGQVADLSLPPEARRAALNAEYQALQFGRVGLPVTWAEGGYSGEVVPTQLYRIGSQECRGYAHTVVRGAASARQTGTACREDALWTPVA